MTTALTLKVEKATWKMMAKREVITLDDDQFSSSSSCDVSMISSIIIFNKFFHHLSCTLCDASCTLRDLSGATTNAVEVAEYWWPIVKCVKKNCCNPNKLGLGAKNYDKSNRMSTLTECFLCFQPLPIILNTLYRIDNFMRYKFRLLGSTTQCFIQVPQSSARTHATTTHSRLKYP